LLIITIGVLPQLFITVVAKPVTLYTDASVLQPLQLEFADTTQRVSLAAVGLILLSLLVLGIKQMATASGGIAVTPTWGCGYAATTPRLQYTANSFVRSFRKLIHSLLIMNKKEDAIEGVFPGVIHSETHPYDKIEAVLIDNPTRFIRGFMGRFRFVQNGSIQFYISYGIVFIFIVIIVPLLLNAAGYVIDLLKQI